MKKRILSLLLALVMLCTLLPQTVLFAGAVEAPATLCYGGAEYQLLGSNLYTRAYMLGSSYILAAKDGDNYYALDTSFGAAQLTVNDGKLLPSDTAATLLTLDPKEDGEEKRIYDNAFMQLSDGSYLCLDDNNGLYVADQLTDTTTRWFADGDGTFHAWRTNDSWNTSPCLHYNATNGGFVADTNKVEVLLYQQVCAHDNKTLTPAKDASCTEAGCLAHGYCPDCGSWLDETGEYLYFNSAGDETFYWEDSFLLKPTGHHYENGVCTNDDGHAASVYELVTSDDMIVAGDEYRYLLVSESGKTVGIDGTKEYDDERMTICGTSAVEGGLIIDNSGDPQGVFAAELKLAEFSSDDPYLTLPQDDAPLFVPVTEQDYVMMLQGEFRMYYDAGGNAKYPVGISVENDIATVHGWNYGSWGAPVFFDADNCFKLANQIDWDNTTNEPIYDKSSNIKLYRSKVGDDPAQAGEKVALIADEGGVEDGGFNQQVHEAAKAWCETNRVAYATYVFDDSYNTEQEGYGVGIVEKAIREGATVLILPGFSFTEATAKTAAQYPDVKYILLDVDESSLLDAMGTPDGEIPSNVYLATYREEQAGFLAGYAAVAMGYNKLGFLGGPEFPGIMRFGYGFVQGANAAAKALEREDEVEVRYVYTGQFAPDDEMTEFVSGWYEDGVEVVFACGGGIWASAAEAAAANNGKVIGVDADQKAQIDGQFGDGLTVTSAVKNMGATVVLQLNAILNDTFAGGREEQNGIVSGMPAENPVGLASSTVYNNDFTENDYIALLGKIVSGDLTVSDDVDNKPAADIAVIYQCYTACDWDDPTYAWSDDNATCTATRVCKNDDSHVETETVQTSYAVSTEPTCALAGEGAYTAAFANAAFETQTKKETIAATGRHTAGEPVNENEVAPSCTEKGGYDSVVYCTVCKAELSREHVEIDPTGHTFGAWIENTEDTTWVGHYRKCSVCEFVETAPHAWNDGEVTTEPTCAAAGVKTYTCTVCGATKTEEIEPTGRHTPGEPVNENEVAPSCTEKGGYDSVVYCTVCKAELSREHVEIDPTGHTFGAWIENTEDTTWVGHYRKCSVCEFVETAPHAWNDGEVTTEPTCAAAGVKTYTCTVCGATKTEEIEPTGQHTPGEPVKENEVAPTCTEKGGYDLVTYCTVCQAELSREHVEVEALGHTPGEPVNENEVAPTCTEKGSYDEVFYCTVCRTELSREHVEVEALGHDWKAPTYKWADDYSTVTASHTCKRDETHVESETVETVLEITDPTTEAEGTKVYTAVFTNPGFETQTITMLLPRLSNPFNDTSANDFFYTPVLWAVENGITSGTSSTTFSPNDKCTRAQVVTFIWRAKGKPDPASWVNPFSDVAAKDYYYKAVLWAVAEGVTSGTSKTKFSPNAGCTRGQVVTFLWRAEGKPAPESPNNGFSDVKSNEYYYKAVLWAVENNVTQGTGGGKFSPNKTCTRGQIVTFLYRASKAGGEAEPEIIEDPLPEMEHMVADEAATLALINETRMAAGLKPLVMNLNHAFCAKVRVMELTSEGGWQLNRPDGRAWDTIYDDLGIERPSWHGQILLRQSGSSNWSVTSNYNAIIDNESRLKEILRESYTQVGICLYRAADKNIYTVIFLGT